MHYFLLLIVHLMLIDSSTDLLMIRVLSLLIVRFANAVLIHWHISSVCGVLPMVSLLAIDCVCGFFNLICYLNSFFLV